MVLSCMWFPDVDRPIKSTLPFSIPNKKYRCDLLFLQAVSLYLMTLILVEYGCSFRSVTKGIQSYIRLVGGRVSFFFFVAQYALTLVYVPVSVIGCQTYCKILR